MSEMFSIKNAAEEALEKSKQASDYMERQLAPENDAWYKKEKKLQRNFKYEVYKYPNDLGVNKRHPYFMTFYINTQDLSKFNTKPSRGPAPLSTTEINARTTRTLAKDINGSNIGFGRKTHRTSAAIRLFMPETLAWNFSHAFQDVKLTDIAGTGLGQAMGAAPALGRSIADGYTKGGIMGALASLNSSSGRQVGGPLVEWGAELIPGLGKDLGLSAFGIAINPQIDVIYQSPTLRSFSFEFLFAPRSLDEAETVSKIIHMFKFHAAPEILQGAGLGRYFVPPSEFDIEFSVDTLGKISTCVLEDIAIDYAPSGSHFYTSDHPILTRLNLRFKELEFITKELIERRGY